MHRKAASGCGSTIGLLLLQHHLCPVKPDGLTGSLLKPSSGQELEFTSPDSHQLKLLWSSVLGDQDPWQNEFLNSSPCELFSGSPCMVEFAVTSKFWQSVFGFSKMLFANVNLFWWKTHNCSSLWQKIGGEEKIK